MLWKATAIPLLIVLLGCDELGSEAARPTGPFLGEPTPGRTPRVFAPGVISTAFDDLQVAFGPDGRDLCFGLGRVPHSVIACMHEEEGGWTKPEVASFSGNYGAEFTFSPDGRFLLLGTRRPPEGEGLPIGNGQIWIVERIGAGWGEPANVGPPVNVEGVTSVYPSISSEGNLFFVSHNRHGGVGAGDIWTAPSVGESFGTPSVLPPSVNTVHWEIDPFIGPNERYLLFSSSRPGGFGGSDLYVSFRETDGSWGQALNLGKSINSPHDEVHPMVSLDGRFLFFTSNRFVSRSYSESPLSFEDKLTLLGSPRNQSEDVYWVDAAILEDVKRTQTDPGPSSDSPPG